MNQRTRVLILSASIIVVAGAIWYGLTSTPKASIGPASPSDSASHRVQRSSGDAAIPRSATTTSAPSSPANRAIRIRQLSGKAFAVQDFGPIPSGTVDQVIAELSPQALAGDATASYGIFLKLNQCADVTRRASRGANLGVAADVAKACMDMSAETEASSSKWLSLAAEQGNIGARLLYSADSESALGGPAELLRDPDRTKEYKQKATGYLQEMASQGNVDALLQLGNAYHAGVLVDGDLVTSRAYFEAVRLADPSIVPALQVSTLDKALSAQQLSMALRKGNQIHDSCCR